MPMSHRVRQDPFTSNSEVLSNEHVVDTARPGRWRIYEYHQEYSTTSGGFLVKGKVVRFYHPNAGILEGKAAEFPSKEEAVSYWERWIKPHERKQRC
jgi:hypothetical protein